MNATRCDPKQKTPKRNQRSSNLLEPKHFLKVYSALFSQDCIPHSLLGKPGSPTLPCPHGARTPAPSSQDCSSVLTPSFCQQGTEAPALSSRLAEPVPSLAAGTSRGWIWPRRGWRKESGGEGELGGKARQSASSQNGAHCLVGTHRAQPRAAAYPGQRAEKPQLLARALPSACSSRKLWELRGGCTFAHWNCLCVWG